VLISFVCQAGARLEAFGRFGYRMCVLIDVETSRRDTAYRSKTLVEALATLIIQFSR
jgi:hypothetical protein